MALIASRSPSPNHSRSQSPSPRGPNAGKVAKKVPWVNPSSSKHTIFSSPSDILHRNLDLKGGSGCTSLRASFENKENDRDLNSLKLNKAKSPVAAPSKGTKSFMSPTISASSKIIAASPKRKILSERNDGTRSTLTSVSDSFNFTESEECDPKFEMNMGPQVALDTPKVLKASPEQVESGRAGSKLLGSFDLQESHRESQWENGRPAAVITHGSPVIASLDEDPSLPPYDPKTNYLSPRPQFLHYRPKPRIEHYLNRGDGVFSPGDERQLEDRFSSESTEEASEETVEIQSADAQSIPVDDSCSSEVETGEVRTEAHDPEPKTDDHISFKATPKSRFTRSKFVKLFLVMAIACFPFSVIDTPNISSFPVLKREPLRNLYAPTLRILDDPYTREFFVKLKEHANVNFEKFSNRLRDWSIHSISHFRKFFQNFAAPRVESGFFYLTNITASEVNQLAYTKGDEMQQEKDRVENGSADVKAEKSCIDDGLMEKAETEAAEHAVLESIKGDIEDGFESRNYLGHRPQEIEEDIKEGLLQSSLDVTFDSLALLQPSNEAGGPEEYQAIETSNEIGEESEASIHYDNVPSQNDGAYTNTEESQVSTHCDNGPSQNDGTYTDAEEVYGGSQEPQTFHYANFVPRIELPLQTVLGILSVVLALAAIIISLWVRQKHSAAAPSGLSQNKVIFSPVSQTYVHSQSPIQSRPPEAETMGESGPSEVSSTLQNSSSLQQRRSKRGKEQDTVSQERNLRRDSVASSTSYGSFTTYERLSGKKGHRDEDPLTPVRRSSRIRSQNTSP